MTVRDSRKDAAFRWSTERVCISLAVFFLLSFFSGPIRAQDSPPLLLDGDDAFRAGKFDEAAKKYRAALDAEPGNARARYGLTRTLVKKDEIPQALATVQQGLQGDPENPLLLQGLGEVQYRMGEFEEARKAFLAALSHDSNLARSRLGLANVLLSEGRYKSAKFHLQRAYELDPNDPEIVLAWSHTLDGQDEIGALRRYLELAKNERPQYLEGMRSYLEFLEKRGDPGICAMSSGVLPARITIEEFSASGMPKRDEFRTVYPASRMTQPMPFIQVGLNGTKSQTLLLDTGASGVVLNERGARQAGIRPIATTHVGGIGSAGSREAYFGLADKIRIGGLEFRNCIVTVTVSTRLPQDGIIGVDFFSRFLVTLDLPRLTLRLDPHPEAQAIAEKPHLLWEYDRKPTGGRPNSAAVRRSGGDLLIETRMNQVQAGWFLLDTGAGLNSVSLVTAKRITKTNEDPYSWVEGVSGRSSVHEGRSITIEFASFRQDNLGMTVLDSDFKWISKSEGFEVSSILGYPTLRFFTLQIDYLNVTVNFTYGLAK